jgi:uncharacterized protein (PEP-CTERM system associated)
LRHEYDSFRVDARYGRGIVDYRDEVDPAAPLTFIQDADTESRSALIGSVDEEARLSWEATYEFQQAEYDLALPYRYERAQAELGFLIARPLRIIGRVGRESDPLLNVSEGGLDNETWEAGFRYSPGERTRLEAFYGDRFYGKSYSGMFRHEARRAVWTISYVEGPTTQAQEIGMRPVAPDQAQLIDIVPDAQDFSRQTSAVYVRKTAEARVVLTGQRTTIDISALDYRREFLNGPAGEEHLRGGGIAMTRTFSSQTSLVVSARYSDSQLIEGDGYKETIGTIEARRRFGQYFTGSIGVNRIDRSGFLDYTTNWATATLTGEF